MIPFFENFNTLIHVFSFFDFNFMIKRNLNKIVSLLTKINTKVLNNEDLQILFYIYDGQTMKKIFLINDELMT